jgi:hypothetical protein
VKGNTQSCIQSGCNNNFWFRIKFQTPEENNFKVGRVSWVLWSLNCRSERVFRFQYVLHGTEVT